ncbi:MAG TPA: ferritin-like domain-containing protein [Alphaproteobacteria bacterium]|jgi:bacterioferritin|nr:ferritin-like domain-containing protein [Alphaproteobacteria bacterium]
MQPFVSDMKNIQKRARQHITQGAVTIANETNVEQVVKVLNEVLATEIVCTLRYRRHYYMAQGINSEAVKAEFLAHSNEEQQHADEVSTRITQLNGEPDLNPDTLMKRSHSPYDHEEDLIAMIREDLVAERIAIETYHEIVRWLGDQDPTTRRMMERILEKEEEHAEELVNLLDRMPDH